MHRLGRRLLLTLLAFLPTMATAKTPDFTGEWALDSAKSSSIGPILELQSLPGPIQMVAGDLDRGAVIAQQPERMTICFDSLRGELEPESPRPSRPAGRSRCWYSEIHQLSTGDRHL